MTVVPGGPVLLEGPVDVEMPDGTVVHSDRPVVALCTCRRTRRAPWCDTSHRARVKDEPVDDARAATPASGTVGDVPRPGPAGGPCSPTSAP